MAKKKAEKERIIAFDWNGCLLDDFVVAHKAMNRVLTSNDKKAVTAYQYRKRFTMPFTALYGAFGFNAMPENGQAIYGETVKEMAPKVKVREDADLLLINTYEQGVKNIIVSNSPCQVIKAKLQENKLDALFHEIIGIDHPKYGVSKSKSDNLGEYLQEHSNYNLVTIGDTFEEIEMAEEYGGTSVAITGGYISEQRLRKRGPNYLIDNFKQFGQVLNHIGTLKRTLVA